MANCPFLVFSANVSNMEEDTNYANTVKADSVARVRKTISKDSGASGNVPRPSPAAAKSGEKDKGQSKAADKGQDKGSQDKSQDRSQGKSAQDKSAPSKGS